MRLLLRVRMRGSQRLARNRWLQIYLFFVHVREDNPKKENTKYQTEVMCLALALNAEMFFSFCYDI